MAKAAKRIVCPSCEQSRMVDSNDGCVGNYYADNSAFAAFTCLHCEKQFVLWVKFVRAESPFAAEETTP